MLKATGEIVPTDCDAILTPWSFGFTGGATSTPTLVPGGLGFSGSVPVPNTYSLWVYNDTGTNLKGKFIAYFRTNTGDIKSDLGIESVPDGVITECSCLAGAGNSDFNLTFALWQ
jgi:hypothetical protein